MITFDATPTHCPTPYPNQDAFPTIQNTVWLFVTITYPRLFSQPLMLHLAARAGRPIGVVVPLPLLCRVALIIDTALVVDDEDIGGVIPMRRTDALLLTTSMPKSTPNLLCHRRPKFSSSSCTLPNRACYHQSNTPSHTHDPTNRPLLQAHIARNKNASKTKTKFQLPGRVYQNSWRSSQKPTRNLITISINRGITN
jgi:hypothetical protein